jgi:16S rRNA (cytosine967-C5)-methyltransferase
MTEPGERSEGPRYLALKVLNRWSEGGGYAEDLLADELLKNPLPPADRHLAEMLVYGVLRKLRLLDYWIGCLASRGMESLPVKLHSILRIGLVQLAFLDRVPDHAAVDESVRLCEKVGLEGLKKVTNGILRNFQRRREELDRNLLIHPQRWGIETSHPEWLLEWATSRWGENRAHAWMQANQQIPHLYVAPLWSFFTSQGMSHEEALAQLLQDLPGAIWCEQEGLIELPEASVVANLDWFRKGVLNVQDPAARQAVRLLAPQPGETLLDLCSAPGGKTLQIADELQGKGQCYSVDVNRERLGRVKENLQRCGFTWVKIVRRDLLREGGGDLPMADGVLVDVPCSGLGTLRRRVDLRYRLTRKDIDELAAKANVLLTVAASLVKPEGRLVYSTCTLSEEENRGVVEKFLEENPDWKLECDKIFPEWLSGHADEIPNPLPDHDASYCAKLVRQ